jgi:hypothetical protein
VAAGSGVRCRADPCKTGRIGETRRAAGIQQHAARAPLGGLRRLGTL